MASSHSSSASPILPDAAEGEYNRGSSSSQSEPRNFRGDGDDESSRGSSHSAPGRLSIQHAADDRIEVEDECPICFELLFDPLITHCRHTFCRICLEDMISKREESPVRPESLYWFESRGGLPRGVRCPICQQQTYVTEDTVRVQALRQKYPGVWASRGGRPSWGGDNGDGIQTITFWMANSYVGTLGAAELPGFHRWTFILQPTRTDIIAEVQISIRMIQNGADTDEPLHFLVQAYHWIISADRAPQAPTMTCHVRLKEGYQWVFEDQWVPPVLLSNTMLPPETLRLEWILGLGSGDLCRFTLKFKMVEEV
ncbi:hypothetical protein DL765_006759 [Monosporascus sp. GIB2]|nr:hypothetical protein DL765_006759 [Monosporascus sp. GIB2]